MKVYKSVTSTSRNNLFAYPLKDKKYNINYTDH